VVDPDAFLDDLRRLPTLAEWGLDPGAVAARLRPGLTAGEAISAIFATYAAEQGKQRWGDKTPLYMQHLPVLERLFPDARYVHLIRDGRDAALSFLSVPAGLMTEGWGYPRDAQGYRKALESCLTDARLLRRLVERLMEQCRADTLSHDEAPQEMDVAPLLEECVDRAAAIGAERQVTVERTIPARLWQTTQPQRLRSVVTNLLSNAVDYNRVGGSVELAACQVGESLQITVRDTGPGIESTHLPHLFEPFYRADKARSQEAGHLGLGLSLVQAHVQAMGGQIRVESVPGRGTVFEVTFPAKGGLEASPTPAPTPVACAQGLS